MKDPAALLFIDTWLTSTSEMDADVRGWYLNLILHQYDKKDLPNDVEKLAVLAGVKFSEYKRFEQVFEQVFKQKFKQNDFGRLENPLASEIIRKRESFKDKRSNSGKLSYFIRYITNKFKPKKDLLTYIKDNADLTDVDLKNEQMLKHLFEHLSELYINGDGDNNNNYSSLWKKDYSLYLKELNENFEKLVNDEVFISEQERLNPNIIVRLTMEKAKVNFWATEAGWSNKKKARTTNIDWKATFINALSISSNKVYKPIAGSSKQTSGQRTSSGGVMLSH